MVSYNAYNSISTDMPEGAYTGQVYADSSSSERLLNVIRGLEYDDANRSAKLNTYDLQSILSPVSPRLGQDWANVGDFFDRVRQALSTDLNIVKTELEVYSTSSIENESELVSILTEIVSARESILGRLGLSDSVGFESDARADW